MFIFTKDTVITTYHRTQIAKDFIQHNYMNYLILQYPGHNWVYYQSADQLALAELQIAGTKLECGLQEVEIKMVANLRYIHFSTDKPLSERDLNILSKLSFVFALFKVDEDATDFTTLTPIELPIKFHLDPKISTLLKYKGKTNELFTHMMLNIAVHSSDFAFDKKLELLDPVSGKGTTLFEASTFGYDAYGIEVEGNALQEGQTFFKKFLEEERFKHTRSSRVIFKNQGESPAEITEFEYALSKQEFKDENTRSQLAMVHGAAAEAFNYFKKERFHVIVGDLPYGIKHGNKAGKVYGSPTRNPVELITECIPGWKKVLRKGGTIVLAWNSHVITRKKMARFFEEAELEVLNDAPYDQIEHRVDAAIKRDVIVVKKN